MMYMVTMAANHCTKTTMLTVARLRCVGILMAFYFAN